MKILNKTSLFVAVATMLTAATSCKKLLVEKPESALYPSYFTTAGGIQAAITGVYSDLRSYYSGEGIVYFFDGTDENIAGGSGNPTLDSYNGINSSNFNVFGGLWSDINTLNGVLQFAPTSSLDATTKAQLVAQAKFLRAYMYFHLVQTYGGTTATQKSGIPLHTTFITAATTADAPAALSDIYAQIIQDFTDASTTLPNTVASNNPFSAAGVGKPATAPVALAYLAKAYLTRGYTEAAVSGDYQKAADLTAALIANKGTYNLDLWQDFNDEHKPANDYGKENMFNIDYGSTNDPTYTGNTQQASGGYGINLLYVLAKWNYFTGVGIDNVTGIDAVPQKLGSSKVPMLRDVYNGRPYIRLAPNGRYTFQQVFTDRIHDTRYDATFQTFWICNQATAAGLTSTGTSKGTLQVASNVSLTVWQPPLDGDTAFLMPGINNIGLPRRDAFKGLIVAENQYTNTIYPSVKKFEDPNRTGILDFSGRPMVMMRFSEIYLMNAEANYMLGTGAGAIAAANDLNVLRTRAAYRVPADGNFIPKGEFSVTAATQATANAANAIANQLTAQQVALLSVPNNTTSTSPNICGMDVILDEYSRELYGDPRRWYDLVRTKQLTRRVKLYNPNAVNNIQDYMSRRPIPQVLIQSVLTGPTYPQNNGY